MKTLADFKRQLKVGVKLAAIYHKHFAGRTEEGKPVWTDKDLGTREVSIVQSNSFALKTPQTDGTFRDSWCHFPKAKECKINNDSVVIYEEDGLPVLTYRFVE